MVEKIISIDLDDVISLRGDKPNILVIQKINLEFEKGNIILINTARSWVKYIPTKKWLEENNVKHNELVMGKVFATHYIDDKNQSVEEFSK